MKWLVFSKDRPYQLDAFLKSAQINAKIKQSNISVLYRYSEEFKNDIDILSSEHPHVFFIAEENFKQDVMNWLYRQEDNIISFATDDAVFTREFDYKELEHLLTNYEQVTTLSLRLGLHLEHCYPTNSYQKIPDGQIQNGIFFWNTQEAEGDWGYPLSVDGHAFRRQFVIDMLHHIDFNNPNSLESNWQILKSQVSSLSSCFPKSSYFNIPINKVQNDYNNRSGNVSHFELAKKYREDSSFRFNPSKCKFYFNKSAHEEIEII